MINKGDTVFCIKSFSITGQKFYKGKSYEIDCYYENYEIIQVYILGEIFNKSGGGYWFRLNGKIVHNNKFSDYFMTMAEWRDKQINSILDD
jgi:hypothetical protein